MGHIGLQIESKMGLVVDAFMSKNYADPKDRLVPEFGATRVIHWNTDDLRNWANTYYVILNTDPFGIPAEKMDPLLNCLKLMGKFIVIRLPALEEKLTLNYRTVIRKSIEVIGTWNDGIKKLMKRSTSAPRITSRLVASSQTSKIFPRRSTRWRTVFCCSGLCSGSMTSANSFAAN